MLLLIGTIGVIFSGLNWHIGIAAWIAPIFLLMFTRNVRWKQMLLFFTVLSASGAISQTGNNLLHLPEVHVFNGISFGILFSIPYLIDKLLYNKSDKFYYTLIFPATISIVEFIASFAIGTWGSIAHTQYEFKPLMQLSSLTGIYGIWFLVSWFASTVNWIIENKTNHRLAFKGGIIFCSVFLAVQVYGITRIMSGIPDNKTVKVAAIISENDIEESMDIFADLAKDNNRQVPPQLFSTFQDIQTLIIRTDKAANNDAKIIVWNEIALILNQEQKKLLYSDIKSICIKNSVYVLVSFIEECPENNKKPFNNISTLISPSGKIEWEYKKSFLHPTAEMPIINAGNFELPVIGTQFGAIGNVICADLDMQHYIKQAGKKSVDILLVPAYDWEGITPLHAQMANIQAIQFGCNLVRANGKGLSTVYNYKGNEIASINNLESSEKILYAELPVNSANTIYSYTGNVFIVLCTAFLLLLTISTRLYPPKTSQCKITPA